VLPHTSSSFKIHMHSYLTNIYIYNNGPLFSYDTGLVHKFLLVFKNSYITRTKTSTALCSMQYCTQLTGVLVEVV